MLIIPEDFNSVMKVGNKIIREVFVKMTTTVVNISYVSNTVLSVFHVLAHLVLKPIR